MREPRDRVACWGADEPRRGQWVQRATIGWPLRPAVRRSSGLHRRRRLWRGKRRCPPESRLPPSVSRSSRSALTRPIENAVANCPPPAIQSQSTHSSHHFIPMSLSVNHKRLASLSFLSIFFIRFLFYFLISFFFLLFFFFFIFIIFFFASSWSFWAFPSHFVSQRQMN